MRCLVFAYSEIGAAGFEALLSLGHDVVGLVTHEDHPAEERWWRSVRDLATSRSIPTITPDDPNTPEVAAWAEALKPDILFSFYYRQLLKPPLLTLAKKGAFNLHGSLLPKYRGRAPVNWAILEGATETGLTLHEMIEKPDAGDIVAQEAVPIGENDTAKTVFDRLVPLVPKILGGALPLLEAGTAPRKKQDETQATIRRGRGPEDGRIDWSQPAPVVHNLVRAVTRPYPGAFTYLHGEKVLIWKGHVWRGTPFKGVDSFRRGRILGPLDGGIGVHTGAGCYVVTVAELAGKPDQPPAAFLKPGMTLKDA
jgi:methionyl-tRNA formyltransferase